MAQQTEQAPGATRKRRLKPDMTGKALTLRATLRGVPYEVWRLVRVRAEMTLADLSDLLEDVVGWDGYHLHIFSARGITYWTPPEFVDDPDLHEDDTQHQIGEILYRRRMKLAWEYDLGDCWEHDIVVESIDPVGDEADLPHCIDGSGACPLEDRGGDWRYAYLLGGLADKSHPAHDQAVEWFGGDFDPLYFDADEWNARYRKFWQAERARQGGEPAPVA